MSLVEAVFKLLNGSYRLSYLERAELAQKIISWIALSIPEKISIPQVYPEGNDYEKGWNDCIEAVTANLCRVQDADHCVRQDSVR